MRVRNVYTVVVALLVTHFNLIWCISSPDGFKEFNPMSGETVAVSLHLPSEDNFSTTLDTTREAIQQRQRLVSLYYKGNDDELIYLKIGTNNTVALAPSPLLFGSNFTDKSGHFGDKSYDPVCMYSSTNLVYDALLNLCSGVKGYFQHGPLIQYIQPVTRKYSNKLRHIMRAELNPDDHNATEWGTLADEIASSNAGQRVKRKAWPRRWMEVYAILDWDFYRLACLQSDSVCERKVLRILRAVSLILRQNVNLVVVLTQYEIFSKEDNQAYNLQTGKTNIDDKPFQDSIINFTSKENIKKLREKAYFDVLVFLTKLNPVISHFSYTNGFATVGWACHDYTNYAVSHCFYEMMAVGTLVHELLHTVGVEHCGGGYMSSSEY